MALNKVRKITSLYYSRPEVQKAIFDFSKNREISARYFDAFGKRPDSFQYIGDVFQMVKRGATSFHCSEELWEDPLKISTGMSEKQLNELRIGWDLVLDIDCKWFDYSKLAAKAILQVLKNHNLKNIGVKFSGSKGWHILIPWKTFPKELRGEPTKDLFPEVPRIIVNYIKFMAEKELKKILPKDFHQQFEGVDIKRGIKCMECNEIVNEYNYVTFSCKCGRGEYKKFLKGEVIKEFNCPEYKCGEKLIIKEERVYYECHKCKLNSKENPDKFSKTIEEDLFELMGLDIILVSPRHLFRMPYSLHEKTSLASVVINSDEVSDFQPKDADPLKVKVKNFLPESKKEEATELLREALDWNKESNYMERKKFDFKPVVLKNLSEKNFPPSIQRILKGMSDGRKRALFILINLFRSVGMDKDELEKRIYGWNKENKVPLKEGYIKAQISWSYRNKIVPPPNFDKDYYKGIGIIPTEEEIRYKNPVSYVIKKSFNFEKKKSPVKEIRNFKK